jgi:peroxiredoxin
MVIQMTLRVIRSRVYLSTLGVIVALAIGCGASQPGGAQSPTNDARGADAHPSESAGSMRSTGGARPPDFELETLDGDVVRLSDHLGRDVILIDFWATYCDPCLVAMPHLDRLYQKYKSEGFVVLGISVDGPESVANVRSEVAKLGVSFPILLDQETRVAALYNPKTSAPYSVLIGRDGSVLAKKEGFTTGDISSVEREVEAALAHE